MKDEAGKQFFHNDMMEFKDLLRTCISSEETQDLDKKIKRLKEKIHRKQSKYREKERKNKVRRGGEGMGKGWQNLIQFSSQKTKRKAKKTKNKKTKNKKAKHNKQNKTKKRKSMDQKEGRGIIKDWIGPVETFSFSFSLLFFFFFFFNLLLKTQNDMMINNWFIVPSSLAEDEQ